MEEIYYYNLDEYVVNKDVLSKYEEHKRWHIIPYETSNFSGRMIACGEVSNPPPVIIDLKVKGWFRIYLGMLNPTYVTTTIIDIDGYGKSIIETPNLDWEPNTWIQETLFTCLDLSNKTFTISKPLEPNITSSGIGYIKLIKMTEDEVTLFTKTTGGLMSFHMDQDTFGMFKTTKIDDYFGLINNLEGFNGGTLFLETTRQSKVFSSSRHGIPPLQYTQLRELNSRYFDKHFDEINNSLVELAHSKGIKVYSARRIQMGDFQYPLSNEYIITNCVNNNDDCCIYTRDNRKVNTLSYAYEKVRKMAVDSILYSMKDVNFDGVQLFFHRGIFMGFEQPIQDKVQQLYGVDARVLPLDDKRLRDVYSIFMTSFMTLLREELDKKYGKNNKKISIVCMYTPENSSYLGVDVDKWCRLGLIDCVCQGLMSWKEDLTNCLDESGYVDISRYKDEYSKRQIINRYYDGDNIDIIVKGSIDYKKICDKYNVDYYATLGWSNADLNYTFNLAKKLREVGIFNLYSWNMNHKIRRLDLLNTEKCIATNLNLPENRENYVKLYRVNKFDDKDITYFNSSWNG